MSVRSFQTDVLPTAVRMNHPSAPGWTKIQAEDSFRRLTRSQGIAAVHLRRLQFSIRSLMIAVVVVACTLALLKKGPESLLVVLLLGTPLAVLSVVLARVPKRCSGQRFGISALMLGLIFLGAGWFSARSAIWVFQREAGTVALNSTIHASSYRFFGVAMPAGATAFGLILNLIALADILRKPTAVRFAVVGRVLRAFSDLRLVRALRVAGC